MYCEKICITFRSKDYYDKKVTLSVPDELYERMIEWKSSMNFSKVFQTAISGMIQKKETLKAKVKKEIDFSSNRWLA